MGPAGHAKVILNILDLMYVDVAAILDDREELDGQTLLNRPVFLCSGSLAGSAMEGHHQRHCCYRKQPHPGANRG